MAEAKTLTAKETGAMAGPEAMREGVYYTPAVDIYETADEVAVLCDMPGVKPQDLDVRFENGELRLHGKVAPPQKKYLSAEYDVGDYYRSFNITTEIDADKISAECHDGVLTVHLPKQEKMKPKRIAVKAD